jgi:hypothetical protein
LFAAMNRLAKLVALAGARAWRSLVMRQRLGCDAAAWHTR